MDSLPLNRLYVGLVLAILVVETAVMLAFHFFLETLHLAPLVEGLADSLVLVIFLMPILHFLFYRPLSSQIARYKQALESIQELKISYGVIIRTAMDSFWLTDIQGRILEVNDSYCRLTGYSRQELLTMPISEVEAREKPEDTQRHIQRIIESGSDRFESKHRCKDGRIVDLEVSVNYLAVEGGRLLPFCAISLSVKGVKFC
ncbi:MAG: PAS domain S-box protein [Candidatus Omnitrophota bacterium]